jgi:bifunctional DNA-binding transcriptional regulator/antitoxin component of YhaV-PrlF toxin-antitoxin module
MTIYIVIYMNDTITITSKGQTTLPVSIRRKLGLDRSGGVLRINFNERKGELVISKPVSIAELSERVSRHIKPGTKPVENVDEYYQKTRKTDA